MSIIKETSAGSRFLEKAGTPADLGKVSTLPVVGFKNKIINGCFRIAQRGASQTANGYGSVDRWYAYSSGTTKTMSQQAFTVGQSDVPDNPEYYFRSVVSSVTGAANACQIWQPIEGVRTFAGQKATLSFYAKADASKNMAVEFYQDFGSGGTPSSDINGIEVQTVPLTSVWQKFTYTVDIPSISGKTLGTDDNDALFIIFWFDAGSDFNSRTNSLGQQSGTFDITKIQLEKGSVATEWEDRPIGAEAYLCYRYYLIYGEEEIVIPTVCIAGDSYYGVVPVMAPMRTDPSFTSTTLRHQRLGGSDPDLTPSVYTVSPYHVSIYVTDTAAGGDIGLLKPLTGNTIELDAEL